MFLCHRRWRGRWRKAAAVADSSTAFAVGKPAAEGFAAGKPAPFGGGPQNPAGMLHTASFHKAALAPVGVHGAEPFNGQVQVHPLRDSHRMVPPPVPQYVTLPPDSAQAEQPVSFKNPEPTCCSMLWLHISRALVNPWPANSRWRTCRV